MAETYFASFTKTDDWGVNNNLEGGTGHFFIRDENLFQDGR
jgi:hypothetical protein